MDRLTPTVAFLTRVLPCCCGIHASIATACDFWLQVLRCSGPPSAVATLEVDRRFHIVVPSRVWQAVTLMSLAVASPTVPLCAAENSLAKARASSASELFVNRGVPKRRTANVDTLPMLNASSSQLWASINAAPRTWLVWKCSLGRAAFLTK